MELTTEIRQRIVKAVSQQRPNFEGSDAKYATMLGINKAVYARMKKGETERLLADVKWISLARRLDISLGNEPEWQTAVTPVFSYITKQLEYCQKEGTTGIYCDKTDIGKTHSAKEYVKRHKNAVYVDCALAKTKQKMVRAIAKEFGVEHTGKYLDVFEDLVFYVKAIANPIVILDEAGDLDYTAFLELKALWNATENYCGWYMMGADGLKAKIERGISFKKVGYTEIFSRFGGRFQSTVPAGANDREEFLATQTAMVIKANFQQVPELQKLVIKTGGSLRRARKEVTKLKRAS